MTQTPPATSSNPFGSGLDRDQPVSAIDPFRPQPGTQQPEGRPATLEAAMNAAYGAAWSELRAELPHGVPVDELDPKILDSWICSAAAHLASEMLQPFLPQPLCDIAARGQAAAALYDVTVCLSTYEPDTPERMQMLSASTVDHSPPKAHPREPWRPMDEAMTVAFKQACDEYLSDFPEGIPFAALGEEVYKLFFTRGRFVAFEVFEPVLPREAAIQMAEAIGAHENWLTLRRQPVSGANQGTFANCANVLQPCKHCW